MPKRSVQQRRPRATTTSDMRQPRRAQPLRQTGCSARLVINADVLQIITEYTAQISSVLCQRTVSKLWYGAVTQAIGFLNGRNWKSVQCGPSLWVSIAEEEETTRFVNEHFKNVKIGPVLRLMTVCLQRQLEKLIVTWSWIQAQGSARDKWSVRLLGERNDCLKQLQLFRIDVCDVCVLRCFSALEQINFYDCTLDVDHVTAFAVMPSLTQLSLSSCQSKLDLYFLHWCQTLRSLALDSCSFVDNNSIPIFARIPALTSLFLARCSHVTNVSALASCPALNELNLNNTDVDAAGLHGLERIPTLQVLSLRACPKLCDVTCLQRCVSLATLDLTGSPLTNEGLRGLEDIRTLHSLTLGNSGVSTVACLSSCRALTSLELSWTKVNDAGVAGLEEIASLTDLDLKGCKQITCVRVLGASRSIRILNLAETSITAEGIAALSKIPTLEAVALVRCQKLNDVRSLRGCRSLRKIWLADTFIVDGGLEGLESVVNFRDPRQWLQRSLDRESSELD
jgi:hypothetical protein